MPELNNPISQELHLGIPPDDLHVGQFVSIVSALTPTTAVVCGTDTNSILEITNKETEQTCEGIPFKVLGISWPWAVFSMILPGGCEGGPYIKDLREIRCLKLTNEYVNAIRSFESIDNPENPGEVTQC